MKKALFFTIFLIVLLSSCLFAEGLIDALFGTSENCDLLYLPRTFVNNANVMIELSQAKGISSTTTTADFSNSDENHQAMFKIRDSLENVNDNKNLVIEITSDNDWNFVNESNAMETRPFSIGVICFDREYKSQNYTTYSTHVLDMNSSHKLVNGEYVAADDWSETTSLTQSGGSITVDFDGTKYTITIPLTSTTDNSKPKYMRDIDFCIVLDETIDDLESGYYSTTLHINTNKQYKTTSSTGGPLSETVNLRGYIGADPGENNATYSFLVSSATDTYSMDLNIPNHKTVKAYNVASVSFLYSEISKTKPDDEDAENRFIIYISPTARYENGGRYQFIKLDSDNQARSDMNTIYYDLYIKTGDNAYTAMNSKTSSTDKAEGKLGSWGRYTGSGNNVTTTYYLRPKYTYSQISSASYFGGETKYQLTWELDQNIWLKINDSTHDATYNSLGKVHYSGMYWSYIYLTLETTT